MTRLQRLLLLALCGAAGGCAKKETPEERALAECKAHYDILWRKVTARAEVPETEDELAAAAEITKPDPWGNPYTVERFEGRFRVWSAGPDGIVDTTDDLCYPPRD